MSDAQPRKKRSRTLPARCGAALLLLSGLAFAADSASENHWLLDHLRHDHARHARLLRETARFNALSLVEQARIRDLERSLSNQTSADQVRLLRAAERYAEWLQRLPPAERNEILSEPDKEKRLTLIRECRQREWVDRLPPAARQKVEKAQATERKNQINRLRWEQKEWRRQWRIAARQWDEINANGLPDRQSKLPAEAQTFIKESLSPRLRSEERQVLQFLEGRWPNYPRTLVEWNDGDRFTFRLLHPATGPSRFQELPHDVQRRLKPGKVTEAQKKRLEKAEGRWPEYALLAIETIRHQKANVKPLGPATVKDFPSAIRDFIENTLVAKLNDAERERLRMAEGIWPNYPRMVIDLARQHRLQMPGASLPGPQSFWDAYRDRPLGEERSMVSDLTLNVFAEYELTPAERATFDLTLNDPVARERLQQEYIKRHPEAWQVIVESDRRKREARSASKGR